MIVVGDLHFDAPQRYEVSSGNLYLQKVSQVLEWVIRDVAGECEAVVFLGDIFEKKDRISNRVKNALIDMLDWGGREKGLWYFFIEGNHDRNSEGESAIKFLQGWGRVIEKVEVQEIEGKEIVFVPWGDYEFKKVQGKCIVLGHLHFKDYEFAKGIREQEGYDVRMFKGWFEGCPIISGHYHKMNVWEEVIFLGSLVQVDWGEVGQEKFILVWRDSPDFVKVPVGIDRVIVQVGSEEDIERMRQEDFQRKWIRFDVAVDRVDIEKLKKVLEGKEIEYYEINVVTSERELKFEVEESAGIERFVQEVLKEVEEEKRVKYIQVLEEVIGGNR